MSFLFAVVFALILPFGVRGARYLWSLRKGKTPFVVKDYCVRSLLDGAVNLVFNLFVALFAFLIFFGMGLSSSALLFLSTSLLLSLFHFGDLIWTVITEKKAPKKVIARSGILVGSLALFLLLDGLVFNGAAKKKDMVPLSFSATDSSYVVNMTGFTPNEDGTLTSIKQKATIEIENLPKDVKTVFLDFVSSNSQMEFVVHVKDGTSYTRVAAYDINASYPDYCLIDLRKGATAYRFEFNLETTRLRNQPFTLKGFRFNAEPPLTFSLLRFWFVVGVAFVAYKIPSLAKKANEAPNHAKKAKLTLLAFVGASLIVLLLVALFSPRGPDSLFAEYPIAKNDLTNYDIYVKLFDAFRKGQLHLDVDPDPKLVALGMDAYVPSARSAVGASVLWDHAFFDGKYYSYFGAAPVILVSFPTYWITGAAPTGLYLQFVAFILSLAAMFYLAIILTQVFSFKPHPLAYGAFVLLLCFGGLFFNLVVFRMTDFKYRVAVDYGLLGALLFVCFVLEAYRGYNAKLMLGFAGLSFVSVMGSRPDFGFWLIFVAPLLLFMLFDKRRSWKRRLMDFVPMAGVLLVGAILLISYNVARFGSMLEFGQSYQLTAFDMRTIKLSTSGIRGALFHYWAQPFQIRTMFGYITTQFTAMPFDTHPYKSGTVGLLSDPMVYLWLFLIPAVAMEKRWHWRITLILMPCVALFTSWTVYSLGGTCFRYLLTLYPLAAVIGLVAFARFAASPIHPQAKMVGYGLAMAMSIGGMLFGMNLLSVPFDGMRGEDMLGFFYYGIRDFLGARNV